MKHLSRWLSAIGLTALLASCPAEKLALDFQARLKDEFASQSFAATYRTRKLAAEGPFARMIIAKLRVDLIVAEGTTGESLRAGAGHYPQTPFPGDVGNVAIACVRSEDGPCRHLDRLSSGDDIVLIVPGHRFFYRVVPAFGGHANPWVTTPNDLSTLEPTNDAALTLTTSDPPETPKNRLILRLRLVGQSPIRSMEQSSST